MDNAGCWQSLLHELQLKHHLLFCTHVVAALPCIVRPVTYLLQLDGGPTLDTDCGHLTLLAPGDQLAHGSTGSSGGQQQAAAGEGVAGPPAVHCKDRSWLCQLTTRLEEVAF